MKKNYERPEIEISLYLVNEAFAACDFTVNMGPSTATSTTTCSDYSEYENQGTRPTAASDDGVATAAIFYIDQENASCGCYYSSGTNIIMGS